MPGIKDQFEAIFADGPVIEAIGAPTEPPDSRGLIHGMTPEQRAAFNADVNTSHVDLHRFATGAVRSKDADEFRYDLISPIGERRLAATCAEGAAKYDDYNWEKGMDIPTCLNHAKNHINNYLLGDRSEDHLAHAAWNLFACMHSEEMWPHLNRNMRRGDCVPPNVTDDEAAAWAGPRAL